MDNIIPQRDMSVLMAFGVLGVQLDDTFLLSCMHDKWERSIPSSGVCTLSSVPANPLPNQLPQLLDL